MAWEEWRSTLLATGSASPPSAALAALGARAFHLGYADGRTRIPRMRQTTMFSSILMLTACASSQTFSAAQEVKVTSELEPIVIGEHHFERRLLANGLRALAVRDDGADLSVFIAVAAGNRQETAETTGLAHLTEHALFTGTPTTGVDEHEDTVKGWGGESNAFTRDDYTLYYDHSLPVEHLEQVLRMEADRLTNLSFEEAPFLHERGRLKSEEKHSYRTAEGRAEELEHAFFERHPYRHGLRTEEGFTKGPELGLEAVRSFYRDHYRPDRLAVMVAGPVDPSEALDAIEAAFASLEGKARAAQVPAEPPTQQPRTKRLPSSLPRDRFVRCWLTPALGHPDLPPIAVLATMLGREKLPSGTVLKVGIGGRIDTDIFQVGWSGAEEVAEEVDALLESYRDGSLLATPSKAAVLDEVKQLMLESYSGQPLRARPYFSMAGTLAWHEALGKGAAMAGWGEAIAAVDAAAVQRVAKLWLAPQSRTLIVFEGTGAPIVALPDDAPGLLEAASQAEETGDYNRAIEAYTRLLALKPDRMNTVIQLATRGQYFLELNDFDAAIADFEAALKVVEYPRVRALLEETEARKARAMRGEFETEEAGEDSGGL